MFEETIEVGVSFCSGRVVLGFFPPLRDEEGTTYLQVFDGNPVQIFPKCLSMLMDSRVRLVFSTKAELDRFILDVFGRGFAEAEPVLKELNGNITGRLEYLLEESYNFKERALSLITFLAVKNRLPARIYRQIFFNEIKGGKK